MCGVDVVAQIKIWPTVNKEKLVEKLALLGTLSGAGKQ